jgi:uncharacterized membrane protein
MALVKTIIAVMGIDFIIQQPVKDLLRSKRMDYLSTIFLILGIIGIVGIVITLLTKKGKV